MRYWLRLLEGVPGAIDGGLIQEESQHGPDLSHEGKGESLFGLSLGGGPPRWCEVGRTLLSEALKQRRCFGPYPSPGVKGHWDVRDGTGNRF